MTATPDSTNLRREPSSGAPPALRKQYQIKRANDRHNSQFIRKLAADFISSNSGVYGLTRDGRLVEIQDKKLTAAVQADLPGGGQLQCKLRQPPPEEPRTAAQTDPLSTGHRQRVPRRPSIGKMIEQAEQAGKPLASITLPDGTKLDFGKPEQQQGNEVDDWIAKHAHAPERH
jgi:hypothetical protein